MGIPTTLDTEVKIGKLGSEELPYNIILKGTMWSIFIRDGAVKMREIDASDKFVNTLNQNKPTAFHVSPAIIGGVLSTDKFLMWTVEAEDLYAELVEPFVGAVPILSDRTLIESGVSSVSATINLVDGIRVSAIDKTASNRGLIFKTYPLNITDPVGVNEELPWPATRLAQISAQGATSSFAFSPVYMDTASPPNVYEEITEIPPPVFTTIDIRTIEAFKVDIKVEVDKDGDSYLVVVPAGSTAPSSVQVRNGQDSTGTPVPAGHADTVPTVANVENSPDTFVAINLTEVTDYDVYVVSEDAFDNVQPFPTKLSFTTLLAKPTFNTLEVRTVEPHDVDIKIEIERDGDAYFVILPDGATAPTSAQVKAGQDATSTPVAAGFADSVSLLDSVENGVGTFVGTNLPDEVDYDMYVVAENILDDLQDSPTLLEFTTPDAAPSFNQIEVRNVEETVIDVKIEIDRDGNGYLVALPDGATAPTSAQVKAGQDATSTPVPAGHYASVALTEDVENVLGSFEATNLTPNTPYDIYVVAENSLAEIQDDPTLLQETTLLDPPTINSYSIRSFLTDTVDVAIEIDRDGKAYMVIVPDGTHASITSDQIKAGQDSTSTPVAAGFADSVNLLEDTENAIGTFIGSNLSPDTAYDIYIAVDNILGDLNPVPVKLDFTTLKLPVIYFVSASGGAVFPYDNPTNAHTSISNLISSLGGSLNYEDIVEVIDDGEITESATINPGADNITIRSYGTDGLDRKVSKPTIKSSSTVIIDSHTNGNVGLKVYDLRIVPQPGCERVLKALSGEFERNIIEGSAL